MGISLTHQKRKRGHSPILRTSSGIEDVQIDKAYASYLHKLGLSEPDSVQEECEDDHAYMMFLGDLKAYGNAYMLDVSINNGVSSPVWYEVENDPNLTSPGCSVDMQSGQENCASLKETTHSQRDTTTLIKKRKRSGLSHELNVGHKDSGLFLEENNVLRRSPRISQTSSKPQKEVDVHGGSEKENMRSPTLVRKRRVSAENIYGVGCQQPLEQDSMPKSKADIIDEAYRTFISGVKVVGDSVFYEYGDGKRVYYEGSDEPRRNNVQGKTLDSSPTPQITTPRPQTPPPKRPTPPTRLVTPPTQTQTAKEDSHRLRTSAAVRQSSKPPAGKFAWFWKAVQKDLRRPFERKEYEDLLEVVSVRKPIKVHRETRRGGYEPEVSKLGNSYLDLYPDLNDEIKKAESDHYKVLNLLRGFFIYLQKLPHGVPKPWKDNYCKTIIPGTRHG